MDRAGRKIRDAALFSEQSNGNLHGDGGFVFFDKYVSGLRQFVCPVQVLVKPNLNEFWAAGF